MSVPQTMIIAANEIVALAQQLRFMPVEPKSNSFEDQLTWGATRLVLPWADAVQIATEIYYRERMRHE